MIRVPRDWMEAGDLYPAFSNVYPEILAPWIREPDFRSLVEGVNARLKAAFEPRGWRAWVDALVGFATGWAWEDVGLGKGKSGMREAEGWVGRWNEGRRGRGRESALGPEGEVGREEEEAGMEVVRCVELRRTAFMSLDFVIPDPKVSIIGETRPGTRAPTRPVSRG